MEINLTNTSFLDVLLKSNEMATGILYDQAVEEVCYVSWICIW